MEYALPLREVVAFPEWSAAHVKQIVISAFVFLDEALRGVIYKSLKIL